ncbi:MAG: T9SS type A sorting domain-containing protein [Candidatus Eisenbacteria bacterium]|uniref:T9SS type A sorting domain-containing protein n=1 Tax=Eiseniibacteriota bacterium TaxID=2212470 RepID=A0A849SKU2_UNCEI|nr:T9SS type A sorting domain-containing protein [Candidatus Eisenbacteria bacterium]
MRRAFRKSHLSLAVARLLLVSSALIGSAIAHADDVGLEWNAATNLAGARWTYGTKALVTGTLTLCPNAFTDGLGVQYWRESVSASAAAAVFNPTAIARAVSDIGILPSKSFALRPSGAWSVVRWTAPIAGTYTVRGRFIARVDGGTIAQGEVAIVRGSELLFSRFLRSDRTGGTATVVTTIVCATGEQVDFQIAPGSTGMGLDATVNWESPSDPNGPVITFGPHRFAMARWPGAASDELAFDPVNRRLASSGALRDRCGTLVSAGPASGVGLAWDHMTSTYWQVTPDRVVRRWSAAGALLDTVFTVPSTFTVPGSGLDTLESVRGITVDSSFVYFVDAGANPGQITSNAWFKFTRAGAPIKSSRSTNFVANLDADFDALVDDIVWSPMTSPVYPGRLLIALEHSGIQVVDRDGNFIAKFRWSTQDLPPKNPAISQYYGRLGAFAGLALDPLTGNLYLGDNDKGYAQAWVRLPGPGTTSFAIGVFSALEYPRPGCTLPLWEDPISGPVMLGLAWRPSDAMGYTVDVNTGDLWRLDPRTGVTARLGPTGASARGVAYAADRDALYVLDLTGIGDRVFVVDPRTAEASPLAQATGFFPTDLAYNAVDGFLYGIDNTPPARLIRINRDTGSSTVVGNTTAARGLDWDPGTNRLWAVGYGATQGLMLSIDPATGATTTLSSDPGATFRDGLAVIRATGSALTTAVESELVTPPRAALQATPNPARDEVKLTFSLPLAGEIRVRIFDVAGREVRSVHRGALAAGVHRMSWDGRDDSGRRMPAGVYFARAESGSTSRVARIVRVD